MGESTQPNPIVTIAGVTGAMSALIVTIVAVFAKEHLDAAPFMVASLVVMAIVLGYLVYRRPDKA
jgi:hypothetical protein